MTELVRSALQLMRMALALLDMAGEKDAAIYLQQAIDTIMCRNNFKAEDGK